MVINMNRISIISFIVVVITFLSVQVINGQQIEIAKFALDDNELKADRVEAEKEFLWSISPEKGKNLFLLDKFVDDILYVEQTDIDNQVYKLTNLSNPDNSTAVAIEFSRPENVEVIKLVSNYIISCEIVENLITDDGDNYYKYLVKSFNLTNGKVNEILSGICSVPLLVPNVYRDTENIFIVGEDVDVYSKSTNLFIKVFDTELNLKNEFNKRSESLNKLQDRERWFSKSSILDETIFSNISLGFSKDKLPEFRQYIYDRQNDKFYELDCPKGFEIYDHKKINEKYDLYTLINNRNLNDLALKLADKENKKYYELENLSKFWIMNIYPIKESEFLVQYQNEWQRNHLGILSFNETNLESSQMKLLFNNDEDYAFLESFLNPKIELNEDKVVLYGVNLRTNKLEAYSISIQ